MQAKAYASSLLCLLVAASINSARAEDDPFGSGAKSGENLSRAMTDATVAEGAPDMELACAGYRDITKHAEDKAVLPSR